MRIRSMPDSASFVGLLSSLDIPFQPMNPGESPPFFTPHGEWYKQKDAQFGGR